MKTTELIKTEEKVGQYLVKAFHEFKKLPHTHPSHLEDFVDGIHKCQQIIMWKELQRLNPEKYPSYENSKK